jgi:hypothetical protein
MSSPPPVEVSRARLIQEGWSTKERSTFTGWWEVVARSGKHEVTGYGPTQAEAWWQACWRTGAAVDEQTWLTTADPEPMFACLRRRASERKWRLLSCGCGRLIWPLLPAEECRRAVEVGELLADGRADTARSEEAFEAVARRHLADYRERGPASYVTAATNTAVLAIATDYERLRGCEAANSWKIGDPVTAGSHAALRAAYAGERAPAGLRMSVPVTALLRCLFGNPFRPLAVPAEQRTPDVMALASAIYNERTFTELPALADALEEAGCADAAALAHLRGPGAHARGCHVLDAVLGLA